MARSARLRPYDNVIDVPLARELVLEELRHPESWILEVLDLGTHVDVSVDAEERIVRSTFAKMTFEHRWSPVEDDTLDVTTERTDADVTPPTTRHIELLPERRAGRTLVRLHGSGPRVGISPLVLFRSAQLLAAADELKKLSGVFTRRHADDMTIPKRIARFYGLVQFVLAGMIGFLVVMSFGAPTRAHGFMAILLAAGIYTGIRVVPSVRYGREARRHVLALGSVAVLGWLIGRYGDRWLPGDATTFAEHISTILASLAVAICVAVVIWALLSRDVRSVSAAVAVLTCTIAVHSVVATRNPEALASAAGGSRSMPALGHLQVASIPSGWQWDRDEDAIDLWHEDQDVYIQTWWRDAAYDYDVKDAIKEQRRWGRDHISGFSEVDTRYMDVLDDRSGARIEYTWYQDKRGRVRTLLDVVVKDGHVYYVELTVYEKDARDDAVAEGRRLLDRMRLVEVGGADTIECQSGHQTKVADLRAGGCIGMERA